MIQRYLLRKSRAIAPVIHSQPSRPVSFSPFSPLSLRSIFATSSPRHRIAPRCYSTVAEADASSDSENPAPPQPQSDNKEEGPLKKELEAKSREIIDLKDKYLRSVADFRNLQERTKRDIQAARDFAISRFATDLIESVDNLDRALSTVPSTPSSTSETDSPSPNADSTSNNSEDIYSQLTNLYKGLKMTESILMQTLKKHGLERFDPLEQEGAKFDPRLHEATFQTSVKGKEDGEVMMVQQKGFLLNSRVLRAAKVGVVKNS